MCEFIVYKKDHWMDALPIDEVMERISADPRFGEKYARRYQKGDYVEIREDGYWSGINGKGYNKDAFDLVIYPGISVDDMKHLVEPDVEILNEGKEDEEINTLKRRRYKLSIKDVPLVDSKLNLLASTKTVEELTIDKKYGTTIKEQLDLEVIEK